MTSKMRRGRSALRALARQGWLSVAGSVASPSSSVHLLAGHYFGRTEKPDQLRFDRLLRELEAVATLVPVELAVSMIQERESPDQPVLAFTFDDGLLDVYTDLAPVLEDHGINAALFICPGFVEGSPSYIERFARVAINTPGKRPMTADMIADLSERGFIIGSHTYDHVSLAGDLPAGELAQQLTASRAAIEAITGTECSWFAWPYGRSTDISPRALDAALEAYDIVFGSDSYNVYSSHAGRVISRRHFEADWPVAHVKYFLRAERVHPSH